MNSAAFRDTAALVRVVGQAIRQRHRDPPFPVVRAMSRDDGDPVESTTLNQRIVDTLTAELARSIGVKRIEPDAPSYGGYASLVDVVIAGDSGWADVFENPASQAE